MKRNLSTILACIGASLLPLGARAGVRTTGNGGDQVSLDFFTEGKKWSAYLNSHPAFLPELDRAEFAKTLSQVRVDSDETLQLEDASLGKTIPKDAINDPKTMHIWVSRQFWKDPQVAPVYKRALVLHEYLGILGKERGHYDLSVEALLDRVGDYAQDQATPQLLESDFDDFTKEGIDHKSAIQRCLTARRRYLGTYFKITCKLFEKSWQSIETSWVWTETPVLMGYDVTEQSSSFSSSSQSSSELWLQRYRWSQTYGRYSNYNSASSAYSYESVPVYGIERTPTEVYETKHHQIYGIAIYGVGLLKDLDEKPIYSSASQAFGKVARYYDSEDDAEMDCLLRNSDFQLSQSEHDTFYRARCEVFHADQGYFYVMLSKNPMVWALPEPKSDLKKPVL